MSEHDQTGEPERERIDDLEVKETQASDVQGGAGSTGGSGGDDRPTESISMNIKK